MTLVFCPKHGNNGTFACPHLHAAVLNARPCPGSEYRAYRAVIVPGSEGMRQGCWYCPHCLAHYQLPPDGTTITELDAFLSKTDGLYQPICADCIEEWQRHDWQHAASPAGFLDPQQYPFVATLQSQWESIRDEYLALPDNTLEPWIQRQMHGGGWSAFGLFAAGQPIPAASARCPHTMQALAAIPGLSMAGFSRLAARTHVKPHVGWAASVFRLHLGLVIPANCRLRVATETRAWEAGQCLIFDDTLEHEAWNDSEQPRGILLVDFLRPGVAGSVEDHVPDEVRQYAERLFGRQVE